MDVAFILTAPRIVPSDGVASQAMTWKKELEDLGYHVKLINMWEKNDWKSFSAIILFGFNDPAVRRNFLRRTLCGEEGKILLTGDRQ